MSARAERFAGVHRAGPAARRAGPADRRATRRTRPTSTARLAGRAPRDIIARYPQSRSALLPLLHLVQSEDGYLTTAGIAFCASATRPHRRRGDRGRHVLLDVPAHPHRRVPGRRLHQHAVRDHGRRRDPRGAAGPPRRPRRRDHRRRPGHPRAHRVQRRLRLRARRDGQLGVLRQPNPFLGTGSRRRAARRASRRCPAAARRCARSARPPASSRACPTTARSPPTARCRRRRWPDCGSPASWAWRRPRPTPSPTRRRRRSDGTKPEAVETTKDEPAPAPSATVPAEPGTTETDPSTTDSRD